mgnify:CR=1 FL=1
MHHNLNDIATTPPALLWTEDKLQHLKGTFLFDRIAEERNNVRSIQTQYVKNHPDSEVSILVQRYTAISSSGTYY